MTDITFKTVFFKTAFFLEDSDLKKLQNCFEKLTNEEENFVKLLEVIYKKDFDLKYMEIYQSVFLNTLIDKDFQNGFYLDDEIPNKIKDQVKRNQLNSKIVKNFLQQVSSFIILQQKAYIGKLEFIEPASMIISQFKFNCDKKIKEYNILKLKDTPLHNFICELYNIIGYVDSDTLLNYINNIETTSYDFTKVCINQEGFDNFSNCFYSCDRYGVFGSYYQLNKENNYNDLNAFFRRFKSFNLLEVKYQNSIELINCLNVTVLNELIKSCIDDISKDDLAVLVLTGGKRFINLEEDVFLATVIETIKENLFPKSFKEIKGFVNTTILNDILLNKETDEVIKGKEIFENYFKQLYKENYSEFISVITKKDSKIILRNNYSISLENYFIDKYSVSDDVLTKRSIVEGNYLKHAYCMKLMYYSMFAIEQYSKNNNKDLTLLFNTNYLGLSYFLYNSFDLKTIYHNDFVIRENGFNNLSKLLLEYDITIDSEMKSEYYSTLLDRSLSNKDEIVTYKVLEYLGDKVFSFAIHELLMYKDFTKFKKDSFFKEWFGSRDERNVDTSDIYNQKGKLESAMFQAKFSNKLKLNEMYISSSDSVLNNDQSVTADSFEMLLGALTFDIGLEKTLNFIYNLGGVTITKPENTLQNRMDYPDLFLYRLCNARLIHNYKLIISCLTQDKVSTLDCIHDYEQFPIFSYSFSNSQYSHKNNDIILNYIINDYMIENKFSYNMYVPYLDLQGEE